MTTVTIAETVQCRACFRLHDMAGRDIVACPCGDDIVKPATAHRPVRTHACTKVTSETFWEWRRAMNAAA